MGLFDKMFGHGASEAQKQPNAQQRFDELKRKYQPLVTKVDEQKIHLQNLHVQDNKLFMRGIAPSEAAKEQFWAELRRINPQADDITAEITVDPTMGQPAASGAPARTYTVKAGDTLSKISRQFYGDADEYMQIFYANRDKLKDPDKIQVGQVLTIPEAAHAPTR
ncbi:MAG TPA: LysM peptidoglycan-binding domain-containing protein [Vicinamibacterales bacterium]|nr:LysM peptidoglycan-binding domain-containing protein [Vicinamibacterales bacterium]